MRLRALVLFFVLFTSLLAPVFSVFAQSPTPTPTPNACGLSFDFYRPPNGDYESSRYVNVLNLSAQTVRLDQVRVVWDASVELLSVWGGETYFTGSASSPAVVDIGNTYLPSTTTGTIVFEFSGDPTGLAFFVENCTPLTATSTPTPTPTATPAPTTTPLPPVTDSCEIVYSYHRDVLNSPEGWIVVMRSDDSVSLSQVRVGWLELSVSLISAEYDGAAVFSGVAGPGPVVVSVGGEFLGTKELKLVFDGDSRGLDVGSQDCAMLATATPSPTSIFPPTPRPTPTSVPTYTPTPENTPTPDATATALRWPIGITNTNVISVSMPEIENGDLYANLVSGTQVILQPWEDFADGVAGLVSDDPVSSANGIVGDVALLWSYLNYFSVVVPALMSFSALILFYLTVMLIKVIISAIRYIKQIIPGLG